MNTTSADIVICLFLGLIRESSASQTFGKQLVRNYVASMCPFSNFCYTNASRKLVNGQEEDDLCCWPCSCEANCWKTDNCCIDFDSDNVNPSIFSCKQTVVQQKWDYAVEYQGNEEGIRRYYIVDFCPDSQKNTSLDVKCQAKQHTSIKELIWVADKENQKIYQNQYCAECHGVLNFIPWQIRADCLELLWANVSSLFTALSHPSCSISVEAPDNIRYFVDHYMCFLPAYDKCNVTGQWRDFDPDILSACNKFSSPVFYRPSKSGAFARFQVYKNIFCLACNEEDPTDFQPFCKGLFDIQRGSGLSFSALIDYEKYVNLRDDASDHNHQTLGCRIDEIYDIYLERCRQLLCPYLTAPVHGHCEPLVTETVGLGLSVSYHFKIQASSDPSVLYFRDTDRATFAENILTRFGIASGLRKAKCQYCSLHLYGTTNTTEKISFYAGFYLTGVFYTSTKCQLNVLEKYLGELVGIRWQVDFRNTAFIVLQVEPEYKTDHEIRSVADLKYDLVINRRSCVGDYRYSFMNYCPTIALNYSEISTLENLEKKRLLIGLFHEKQHSAGVLRVCLEEYNSYMSVERSVATSARGAVYLQLMLLHSVFC